MNRPIIPLKRGKYSKKHNAPPSLELTTMIGCPLMCSFCPQKTLKKNYKKQDKKYLAISDLSIILDKLPINTRIDFSGMSEPWANPDCTEMVSMVLSQGFHIAIYSTLYGMKIKDAERLVELANEYPDKIDNFVIHLPDANGNMKGWKYSEEWVECFKLISSSVDNIQSMTMDKKSAVHPAIKDLVETITTKFVAISRAGSLDVAQIDNQPIPITPRNNFSLTCASTPFYDKNVLLPNGDVVLCCMDYSLSNIVGNLLDQNYLEMFQNLEFLNLVKINESNEFNKCSICKSCENVRGISL